MSAYHFSKTEQEISEVKSAVHKALQTDEAQSIKLPRAKVERILDAHEWYVYAEALNDDKVTLYCYPYDERDQTLITLNCEN